MNPWVAFIGHGRQGRSARAADLATGLSGRSVSVRGFVHRRLDVDGEHLGHDLVDLRTQQTVPLARCDTVDPDMCDYKFAEGAFETARRWATSSPAQVTFLELGRLECNKKGHWGALMEVMEGPSTLVVACLRPPLMAPICLALPDPVAYAELPFENGGFDAFVEELASLAPG